jgi:hypothetical protein
VTHAHYDDAAGGHMTAPALDGHFHISPDERLRIEMARQ